MLNYFRLVECLPGDLLSPWRPGRRTGHTNTEEAERRSQTVENRETETDTKLIDLEAGLQGIYSI